MCVLLPALHSVQEYKDYIPETCVPPSFCLFFIRNKTDRVNLSVSVPTFINFNLTRSLAKNAEITTGLHH